MHPAALGAPPRRDRPARADRHRRDGRLLTLTTADGIGWYVQQDGAGPDVVLVPSGEGDCSSFDATAARLADGHRVTTFDMPGFSRSTAPPGALVEWSPGHAATQVVGLLDQLGIATATFYGCSSGGQVVLSLVADHPERVARAVVHEVAMGDTAAVMALPRLGDAEIVATCRRLFAEQLNEDRDAWEALGPDYHARLERNYVTWVRTYVASPALVRTYTREQLHRAPITWTIGALTPAGAFLANVKVALRADLDIGLLPCRHFPQVSIPDVLAAHVGAAAAA